MKHNIIPIIVHPVSSLEKEERKENIIINKLCKSIIRKNLNNYPVEDRQDLIIFLTRTTVYYKRYKKKKIKNKK